MMRAMFAAISGLKQHQTMLDVVANDIANVNTLGYKANRVTFKDSLSQLQRGGAAATAGQGGQNPAQIGLGVSLSSIDAVMGGGALQSTGNVLDVAIQGEGWFRVGQGTAPAVPTAMQYTRAGNFSRNDQGYLVTQDGYYVVGQTAADGTGDGHADPDPDGRHQRGDRAGRLGQLHAGRRWRGHDRGLPVAGEVRQRAGPVA